jgi:hypothetical protein
MSKVNKKAIFGTLVAMSEKQKAACVPVYNCAYICLLFILDFLIINNNNNN